MNAMTITSQIRCSRVPKLLVAVIIVGVGLLKIATYHISSKMSWKVFPSFQSENWGELTLSQNETYFDKSQYLPVKHNCNLEIRKFAAYFWKKQMANRSKYHM
jgi:hypothetical protein